MICVIYNYFHRLLFPAPTPPPPFPHPTSSDIGNVLQSMNHGFMFPSAIQIV